MTHKINIQKLKNDIEDELGIEPRITKPDYKYYKYKSGTYLLIEVGEPAGLISDGSSQLICKYRLEVIFTSMRVEGEKRRFTSIKWESEDVFTKIATFDYDKVLDAIIRKIKEKTIEEL